MARLATSTESGDRRPRLGRGGRSSGSPVAGEVRDRGAVVALALLVPLRWRVAVVVGAVAIAGLAEGAALVGVVHLATALVEGEAGTVMRIGPASWTTATAPLAGAVVLAAGARFAAGVTGARANAAIAAAILSGLRRRLVAEHLAGTWNQQAEEPVAELQDVIVGSAGHVTDRLMAVLSAVASLAGLVALLSVAVLVDPVTVVLVMVASVVLLVLARPLLKSGRTAAAAHAGATRQLAHTLGATSDMALEIQLFDGAGPVAGEAGRDIAGVSQQHRRLVLLRRVLPVAHQLAVALLIVVGLLVLGAVDPPRLASSGAAVLIAIRALLASQPLQHVGAQLHELGGYWQRLEGWSARAAPRDPTPAVLPLARVEELVLHDVSYSHRPGQPVFEDVMLRLTSGAAVAVVGPSGSGKSTLAQLLLRLRVPEHGRYLVNGVPAERFHGEDWCQRFSGLGQEPRLWPGSIADNIRFFRPWIDDGSLQAAAKVAQIHDEVASWPEGYRTHVGARGAGLSMGQRQRLCLARALAGRPDVLVLDEPTSALDERTERLVCEALARLKGTVTLVIFTHRPAPLSICDDLRALGGNRLISSTPRAGS